MANFAGPFSTTAIKVRSSKVSLKALKPLVVLYDTRRLKKVKALIFETFSTRKVWVISFSEEDF